MKRRIALALALSLAIAACQTLAPIPMAPWPERRSALQAIDHYGFSGQLAAATATEGFSASLRWHQQGAASDLLLRAPLGVGGAQLSFDGSVLKVTAGDGSHLEGAAAQAELVRLVGFEPPLSSLRFWLLGAPDPAAAAIETLDDAQRLRQLQQGDWQVDYGEYVRSAGRWLPRRVSVQRGALKLKLRISQWRLS
jgi:outer membrane lipoprotein LolB